MSAPENRPPVRILLVEDNPIDVMAFERGLKRNGIANPIVVAENGQEALDILRGQHTAKVLEKPYIIFTDLNMPVLSGLELLETIREDPRLDLSVVFVLSTSDHEQDLVSAYQNHVAGYILKQDIGQACSRLRELIDAYGRVVSLP